MEVGCPIMLRLTYRITMNQAQIFTNIHWTYFCFIPRMFHYHWLSSLSLLFAFVYLVLVGQIFPTGYPAVIIRWCDLPGIQNWLPFTGTFDTFFFDIPLFVVPLWIFWIYFSQFIIFWYFNFNCCLLFAGWRIFSNALNLAIVSN